MIFTHNYKIKNYLTTQILWKRSNKRTYKQGKYKYIKFHNNYYLIRLTALKKNFDFIVLLI
jgi:hypothetical protein